MQLAGSNTNSQGEFSSTITISNFPAGSSTILATAGATSAIASFAVTDGPGTSDPSPEPGVALDTLTSSDNLLRVWNFNNGTKEWVFYDPRPVLAVANTLVEMISGQPYWVMLVRDQSALLNGNSRNFYEGWNLIPW